MGSVLIIGYGNPLRGDDGVGWTAVRWLEALLGDAVEGLTAHQLLPEMALPISQADQVLFVDATAIGEPGMVRSIPLAPNRRLGQPFTHHMDPSGLLTYAQELYGQAPPAWLLTITGASFEFIEGLSTAVLAARPRLEALVRELLVETSRGVP